MAGGEFGGGRFEGVGEDPIEPEVGDNDTAVVGREGDGVDVGFVLAGWMRAAALVFDRVGRAQGAVGSYRNRGDISLGVVRGEQRATGGVDGEMGRWRCTEG